MTASQKIKRDILISAWKDIAGDGKRPPTEYEHKLAELSLQSITEETVDDQYAGFVELGQHWDYESEFRGGDVETKLNSPYSRHYEAREVARKLSDGSWVGWTYWYGGGKHGNPEEVPWIEDAYDLEVTETEKLVKVQEFKRVDNEDSK